VTNRTGMRSQRAESADDKEWTSKTEETKGVATTGCSTTSVAIEFQKSL
jgi:hypothetical protein